MTTVSSLKEGTATIARYAKTLPSTPGVYRMVDARGKVLYVGKAKNLAKRVASYTQPGRLVYRLQRMVAFTTSMEFVTTHTEAEALLLEANLIKEYSPPYNILLKDDKSFPYILLAEDHDYPQITKHRGERVRKGAYFGPFASAGDVNETLKYLQKIFLLRPCSNSIFEGRTRPCLEYQIKRCSAPCVGKVSKEAYAGMVNEAKAFLSGKSRAVQDRLVKHMQEASEAMEYEQAALLRDRIRALTQIQAKQSIAVQGMKDADVVGVYQENGACCVQVFFYRGGQHLGNRAYFPEHAEESGEVDILHAFLGQFYQAMPAPPEIILSHVLAHANALEEAFTSINPHTVKVTAPKRGEKHRLVEMALQNAKEALERKRAESTGTRQILEGVAKTFDLDTVPQRIEVYDNSHIMGTNEVGAMIVAGPQGLVKQAYRTFNIKTIAEDKKHGDDYAMMREVFTRRFLRLKKEDPEQQSGQWPDLVLIDGGLGQLTTVAAVFADLGITNVAYVAIAKGPERNAGRERFFLPGKSPFMLPKNDPVLYYLQTLRDEAHRFAIGTHRQKRKKSLTHSQLDDIPGIGAKRKKALLLHFGSAKAVSQASVDDLIKVEGISLAVAKQIYSHLHQSK